MTENPKPERKGSTFSLASTKQHLQFEELLEKLGGFGKFQILILVLLLSLEIPVAFVTFIPIFVQGNGAWKCETDLETNQELQDICSCNGTIVPMSQDTIVTEWGLICDMAWVADFIMSIQMLGMFMGNIFGSLFADWYGRKIGFLFATLLLALGSSASAAAPNPYVYAIARFFCGAGIPAFINITCMAVMEFMPPSYRSLSNSIGPTGEGIIILSLLAYFVRPWRSLYWITIAPFLLIVIIYPFVPESPRWLLRNGRVEDAHKVLKYMAKVNGSAEVTLKTLQVLSKKERDDAETMTKGKRFGYLDFFRDKQLRQTSLYLMAIWSAWSCVYFGISYNIKNVGGNIFINVALLGVANAVGQRVAMLINDRCGRRRSLFFSMSFCAIFLVALAGCEIFLQQGSEILNNLTVAFCCLGLLGMGSARSAGRLLSGESFPTAVRTMGLGLGGFASNFSGVLTPLLAFLGTKWSSLPFFIFAGVSVGGSLVSFLMRETTGQPLMDEVNDGGRLEKTKNVDNNVNHLNNAV